jgi:D-inositol-3-phosphate glycosyltransferase
MGHPAIDRPLRVGIVTHYWLPHMGGIEVMARDQAHALSGRGWDVTVFTSRLRRDPSEDFEGAVRIRRFRCANILETRLGVPVPLMSPSMLHALGRAARNLDVLVAHGHVYIGSVYAALVSRALRVPLVVVQSNPFVAYANPVLSSLEAQIDRTLGRIVLDGATKVIAISDFTRKFVESIAPGADVIRIYPGVELDRFFPVDQLPGRKRPLFLTVRRLVPRNGVEVLIHAWTSGDLRRYADLAVVGDGPLRAELQDVAHADASIRFMGRLSDAELPEIYRSADVFVLPTVSGEGYGLALAEALASGLPAIVTDDGAPRELVEHLENGLIVPPDDASTLAKQMKLVAVDAVLRKSLTECARTSRVEFDRQQAIGLLDTTLRQQVALHRQIPEWLRREAV